MKKTVISLVVLAIVIGLGWWAYNFISTFTYTRHITLPSQLLAGSSTDATSTDMEGNATSTFPDAFGQNDQSAFLPASSTIGTSNWKTYANNELGFSILYPQDFTVSTDNPGSLTLMVPKDRYFHWPLLDDVKITITASSTCPSILAPAISTSTTSDNSHIFNISKGSDVGAGNIYRELAYDTVNNNVCYHIYMLDHGTNGAGFYVSDQDLIDKYDSQHQNDLDSFLKIFVGMVDTFKIIETPNGNLEGTVN